MKDKPIGVAMIAGAVILLGIVGFVLYRLTLAPSGPAPKKEDAPAYTRPGYNGPAPYGPQSANQNQSGPPGYARQGYGGGQGAAAPR